MGRFFSNLQIRKNVNQTQSEFIKTFSSAMKKLGYVKTEADEAELSYIAAFSSSKQWVTLCAEDYVSDTEKVNSDAQKIAANLKTYCISNTVLDSDFAVLDMYAGQEERADRIIIGCGGDYGFESREEAKGNRELWEPLMSEEGLWDKFSEIRDGEIVFAEDALVKISELFGISPDLLTADYDELSGVSEDNKAVVTLYFKKAGTKPLSLNAAFVKVFGEALEPLGFKKIKGRHPYFVRVIGDEIIHVITYQKEEDDPVVNGYLMRGYKQYSIIGTVATVYRRKLEFDALGTMLSNSKIYKIQNVFNLDKDYRNSVSSYSFHYKNGDEKMMIANLNQAFEVTKRNLLNAFEEAITLGSCIDFFYKYEYQLQFNYDSNFHSHCNWKEGFVQLMTDSADSFFEREIKYHKLYIERSKYWGATIEFINIRLKKFENYLPKRKAELYAMYNDNQWLEKALEELKKRKAINTEILKSYGLL